MDQVVNRPPENPFESLAIPAIRKGFAEVGSHQRHLAFLEIWSPRLSSQNVILTVPAQPEFLRVVRMTASGLGSRLGFNIDEVDDLRLALDELCFALIGKGTDADLKLTYILDDNALTILGEVATEQVELNELNELSSQILSALVDAHELNNESEIRTFSLTKRQTTPLESARS